MYTGFFKRLHTSSVLEVRQMVHYCMSDMRTTTARNITRICREHNLEVSSVTPAAVKRAWKLRNCQPDDEWKLGVLRDMLGEWTELRAPGRRRRSRGGHPPITYSSSVRCSYVICSLR